MKNKKTVVLLILGGLLLLAGPVFGAEGDEDGAASHSDGYSSIWLDSVGATKLGATIGAGLVLMGGGAGIARIGSAAAESMARQPEASGTIFNVALILGAMVEGAMLFAVVVCLMGVLR